MYYLRYKLYSVNNAMLEKYSPDRIALLDWYRSNEQSIVECWLWHETLGFQYTIK